MHLHHAIMIFITYIHLYLYSFSCIYFQCLSFQVIKSKSCFFKKLSQTQFLLFFYRLVSRSGNVSTLPATEKDEQLNYKKTIWTRKVTWADSFLFFLICKENIIFHLVLVSWIGFNTGIHLSLKNKERFFIFSRGIFFLSCLLFHLTLFPLFWCNNLFICNEFWEIFLDKKITIP